MWSPLARGVACAALFALWATPGAAQEEPPAPEEAPPAVAAPAPEVTPAAAPEAPPPRLSSSPGLGDVSRAWEGQERNQFRFLAYFFSRAEVGNVAPGSDLLKGQTVGRLFGPNTTRTFSDRQATFVEQRLIPFLIFEPDILDGLALLRMSFELDWTWGDAAYSTGGNFGGGFAADQVNLQTQNLEIELRLPWTGWRANLGLQRLFDNPRDPYRTFFETLSSTGQKLAFFGADATGLTLQGPALGQEWRAGFFQLYENNISEKDDTLLVELSTRRPLPHDWNVGATARYLFDSSDGIGGVSILGQGPSSNLAAYNGAYRFDLSGASSNMDILWLGLYADHNHDFGARGLGGSGFLVGNLGRIDAQPIKELEARQISILGLSANLMLGYRWGDSPNDRATAELLYTSGDDDGLDDDRFSGVITGNTWTSPGAVYNSHGAYLLFPHIFVVNRYYGAVSDLSNEGRGVSALFLNASQDLIRNRLTAKVGAAAARANVTPQGGGDLIGLEGNLRLTWNLGPLLAIDAHAAWLSLGDYYDSDETVSESLRTAEGYAGRPEDAWTAFTTLRWLMF